MSAGDQLLNIDTPENVSFGYQVAGIGSRFLAALIDTMLIAALVLLTNLTLLLLLALSGQGNLLSGGATWSWLVALLGLISFAFLWGYYIFFELFWNGQSPGKRWLDLRVLRTDGTPIGLSEAIIRNLVRIVDFLPAYYGVGVITMFVNENARRLGDLAAGTLVVYDRGELTLASLRTRTLLPPASGTHEDMFLHLPYERLEENDIALAESFLQRRHQLQNEADVASALAHSLLARMEATGPQPLTREQALSFLRFVAGNPESPPDSQAVQPDRQAVSGTPGPA